MEYRHGPKNKHGQQGDGPVHQQSAIKGRMSNQGGDVWEPELPCCSVKGTV